MTDEVWRGIGKVIEECGELGQVLGKLIPFPDGNHPDGNGDLCARVEREIADVYAALDYFVETNGLNRREIMTCRLAKLSKFRGWGLTGLPS